MNHGSHLVGAAIASKVYLGLGLPKGGAFFDGTMLWKCLAKLQGFRSIFGAQVIRQIIFHLTSNTKMAIAEPGKEAIWWDSE